MVVFGSCDIVPTFFGTIDKVIWFFVVLLRIFLPDASFFPEIESDTNLIPSTPPSNKKWKLWLTVKHFDYWIIGYMKINEYVLQMMMMMMMITYMIPHIVGPSWCFQERPTKEKKATSFWQCIAATPISRLKIEVTIT